MPILSDYSADHMHTTQNRHSSQNPLSLRERARVRALIRLRLKSGGKSGDITLE